MEILNLVQGSQEWLEARLYFLCASEAPAMMGDSKFMSRNQLLALKKGWQSNPVSSFTQKLYDKGHESEDQARHHIQMEICADIPPVVGFLIIDGLELMASFDGRVDEGRASLIWEHKSWNLILAENVRNGVLERFYIWQLEHQMIVSDSDTVKFTVSDGGTVNRVSMVYSSVPERRQQVLDGWAQFAIDLEAYEIEAKVEEVSSSKAETLPAINCEVNGAMVVSNLADFIPKIRDLAAAQKVLVLESDQDFADKETFNKSVKAARDSLKSRAKEVGGEFVSLFEFNSLVDEADGILQKMQSYGEKQITDAKQAKRKAIIDAAKSTVQDYIEKTADDTGGYRHFGVVVSWDDVIKNKRSITKMQDAVDAEIAKQKIAINEQAVLVRANQATITEVGGDYQFLLNDVDGLLGKDNADLVNLIKQRISDYGLDQEKLREQEKEADIDPVESEQAETIPARGGSAPLGGRIVIGGSVGLAAPVRLVIDLPAGKRDELISLIKDNFAGFVSESDNRLIIK